MKKRIISIILLLVLISNVAYASTLKLDIRTNSKKIKKNEEFQVIVDWKENMQAADFELEYDSKKLEFLEADIENMFYRVNDGKIKVVWISMENKDKTQITFNFKAKENGKTKLQTLTNGGFATGDLVEPEKYKCDSINIQIGTSFYIFGILIVLIVIILILLIIKKIKRNRGEKKK